MLKITAAYAFMCLIWGTTWYAIKLGLHTTPPITGVGVRFLIAGLFMYSIALPRSHARRGMTVPWKLIFILAATLFGGNYVLTYISETHVTSGLAAVLFGTLPFFAFGFGHYLANERINRWVTLGAVIAFAGVAVISLTSAIQGSFWYAMAAVAAAFISAFANVYAKRHSHHDPMVVLPPAMTIAGIVLGIAGFVLEHPTAGAFSARAWLAILYLAIAGSSIAFFLNLWLLQRISVSVVALSSLIIPVLAVFVGIVVGGEDFSLRDILGAALVLIGMWIAIKASGSSSVLDPVPESQSTVLESA